MTRQKITYEELTEVQQRAVSMLQSNMTAVEIGQQLSLSDSTVRGWKMKFKHLIENGDKTQNGNVATFETQNGNVFNQNGQNVLSVLETSKRETVQTKTVQRETVTETLIQESSDFEKTEKNLRVVKISLFTFSMFLIMCFDLAVVNNFFQEIGDKMNVSALKGYSFLGAGGFVIGGLTIGLFGTIDQFKESDFTAIRVFMILNVLMLFFTLVGTDVQLDVEKYTSYNFKDRWFYASVIASISTPLAMNWLAKKLFIIIYEPYKNFGIE